MGVANYVLVGVLGSMLALALYNAKWDISRDSAVELPHAAQLI